MVACEGESSGSVSKLRGKSEKGLPPSVGSSSLTPSGIYEEAIVGSSGVSNGSILTIVAINPVGSGEVPTGNNS